MKQNLGFSKRGGSLVDPSLRWKFKMKSNTSKSHLAFVNRETKYDKKINNSVL